MLAVLINSQHHFSDHSFQISLADFSLRPLWPVLEGLHCLYV